MREREYNDEEVAAIFERASETEHAALPGPAEGKGLTLAALQDIGREVGISPESIYLAAQSLDQAGRPASQRFMGLPIAVGRTVEFDRPLSDSDWEGLVADLRTTFQARGTVRYDGPFRQWTNGNLQALVEPTPNGHRLRLQTIKGDSRALMAGGVVVVGGATATLIALAMAGSLGDAGSVAGAGFMAMMGLGMFAAGALRVTGWARRRKTQIEAVIARLAVSARTPRQQPLRPGRAMPLLFSYGTLQEEAVQLSTIGRRVDGQRDELPGFEPASVKIEDPEVVATTGKTHYANVKFNGNDASRVPGMVFEITDAELARVDEYEAPAFYKRVTARLASGREAWVYVNGAPV